MSRDDEEMGVKEAAQLLGVPRSTCYSWIRRGIHGKRLPAVKRRGCWRVRRGAVLQLKRELNL